MTLKARSMLGGVALLGATVILGASVLARADAPGPQVGAAQPALRDADSFAAIRNSKARSIALFSEAGKVITGPRCMNCHPATRMPTQGEDMHPHRPPMNAGEAGHGPQGLACATCHGSKNMPTLDPGIQSIPGDPHWALAPASMAWQGKTLGQICEQIKDPARNGNRTLQQITHHMAEDHLVGWAWRPGPGRTPAAGSQASFGRLIAAWVATGAHCPKSRGS
jgi:hypothetical protein